MLLVLHLRTPYCSFEANQFLLLLHPMAYVLMHMFRQFYLKGTQYARAQFEAIRLKVIKIGARVRQLSIKVKIHLPSSFPLKEELWKIWRSCCYQE